MKKKLQTNDMFYTKNILYLLNKHVFDFISPRETHNGGHNDVSYRVDT